MTSGEVFVAGSTGNVGSRLVRLLLADGYRVRSGGRDPSSMIEKLGIDRDDEDDVRARELLSPVELDVTRCTDDDIRSAIGESSVVVSALGAPFSFGAVDGSGIARLMRVSAAMEDVKQLIVVSSIGVGRPWVFPSTLFNLAGGLLFFKDYSEGVTRAAAKEHGKEYLIVRPGGMESPTDEFGLTHNLVLKPRNSIAVGLVSNMQIAQLIVAAIKSPDVAANKTVEAVAETTAPEKELVQLLREIAPET